MNDHKGTVLVVEDNDLERQTIAALLQREMYQVLTAPNAQAAMQHLDGDVDVVLSDLRMHGESGVEFLRQWKARRPSTPFIFVTGVYEIAQVVEAVKLGAEDYITKPFNSRELLNRVAECIEAAGNDLGDEASSGEGANQEFANFGNRLDIPANATMEEIERIAIETALRTHNNNRTHAADALGISVRTLQRKLKAWSAIGS